MARRSRVRYASIEERLLANSVPVFMGFMLNGEPSDCWEWIGNRDYDGYGRMSVRVNGKHKKLKAHRVSFEVFTRTKLRDDQTSDHLCRWTCCIHPNHTTPTTRAENTARMRQYWAMKRKADRESAEQVAACDSPG